MLRLWRTTLHLILADALEEGIRESNPAARRRGRGKRAGRSQKRGPEKTITTGLGIVLLAERAALLSLKIVRPKIVSQISPGRGQVDASGPVGLPAKRPGPAVPPMRRWQWRRGRPYEVAISLRAVTPGRDLLRGELSRRMRPTAR
jgi:hypothetical protein